MRKVSLIFSLYVGLFIQSYAQNITGSNITDGNADFSESTLLGGFISWSGDTTNFPNSEGYGGGIFFQRHFADTYSGQGSFKIVTTRAHPTKLYIKFLSAPSVWTGWYEIWHAGDDGAGSGLDADLIRGQAPQWETRGSLIYSTNSGNVLIGKTSQINSSYKLDVAGNVRADKVVVNTTGADFVFDSTYQLRSLLLLEQYLKEQHHLPGINPAKEMQSNGMDVGELQTKLLQKIEELTLYLIRQQKEIAKQQDKLEQQQQLLQGQQERISTLEQLLKINKQKEGH